MYSTLLLYSPMFLLLGSSTGAQVTSVCGTARSGRMFVSSGPAALLRLTSDYSIQQAGFTMRYIMTKTEGTKNISTSFTNMSALIRSLSLVTCNFFLVDHGGCGTAATLNATATVQYLTNKQWPDSYDE